MRAPIRRVAELGKTTRAGQDEQGDYRWSGIDAAAVFGGFVMLGFRVLGYLHICFAGIAIGVLLLIWEFFDRSSYRKLGA